LGAADRVTVPDTVSPMNNTRVTAQKVIHMVFSLERSTRSSGFSFTSDFLAREHDDGPVVFVLNGYLYLTVSVVVNSH
jgi:hypothetical protein